MQQLGGRVLIGLGVIAAAVVAIGYGFVFMGIATPPGGDLGTVDVPPDGSVTATTLDDGRPVYVANAGGEVWVIDARAPHETGAIATLVAWCVDEGAFLDLTSGRAFGGDGASLGETTGPGLTRYTTRPADDPSRVVVEPEAGTPVSAEADGDSGGAAPGCPPTSTWIVHAPDPDEIFDPSVAADEEPPGWIWLEGTVAVVDAEPRLCDGTADPCAGWAALSGIDPATVEPASGMFLGRVRDGAIDAVVFVPDVGGSR